jgi:hypothetical protein
MIQTIRIIIRLIVLPLIAAIGLIHSVRLWLRFWANFIRYGGEAIAYTAKNNSPTIADVFAKVDELLKKDQVTN